MFAKPTALSGQSGLVNGAADFSDDDTNDQISSVIRSGSKIVPDQAEHRALIQDYFRRGGVIKKDPVSSRQPVDRKSFFNAVAPGVPLENTQQKISMRLRRAINQMEDVDFANLVENHIGDLEATLNRSVVAQIRQLVRAPYLERYLAALGIEPSQPIDKVEVLEALVDDIILGNKNLASYTCVIDLVQISEIPLTARAIFYRLIAEGNWASAVRLIELIKANYLWGFLSPQDSFVYHPLPLPQRPDKPSAKEGGRFLAFSKAI